MKIVALCCDKSGYPAVLKAQQEGYLPGVELEVRAVSCLGVIRESLLLEILEGEVACLLLAGCPLESCHNLEGSRFAKARAERVNALLEEADVDKRVVLAFCTAEKTSQIREALSRWLDGKDGVM